MMITENEELWQLIAPSVENLGYDIVRLKWMGTDAGKTLQLMIEQKNGGPLLVDDCERVSHTVSAILDVEDTIEGAYRLEVSSPGIDRPLTRKKDYEDWGRFEMKLETREGIEGRRRFPGKVIKVNEDDIEFQLKDEKKVFVIPFAKILEAKLVLTDELIKFVTAKNATHSGLVEGAETDV